MAGCVHFFLYSTVKVFVVDYIPHNNKATPTISQTGVRLEDCREAFQNGIVNNEKPMQLNTEQ